MVLGINESGILGIILTTATQYNTGDIFLTMLILMIVIVAVALLFGIPLEFTAILIFPLLLSYASFYGQFIPIAVVLLIYIAIVVTKRFIIK